MTDIGSADPEGLCARFELANAVAVVMKARRLRSPDVARMAGVQASEVVRIAAGVVRDCPPETLRRVADVLGIDTLVDII